MFDVLALVISVLTVARLLMPSYAEEAGISKFRLLLCGLGLIFFMISGEQYYEEGEQIDSYGIKIIAAAFFAISLFTFRFIRIGLTRSCFVLSILLIFCSIPILFIILAGMMLGAFLVPLFCILGAIIWLIEFFALFGGQKPDEPQKSDPRPRKPSRTDENIQEGTIENHKVLIKNKEKSRETRERKTRPSVGDLTSELHGLEHRKSAEQKEADKQTRRKEQEKRRVVQALSLWGDRGHRSYDPTGGMRMVGRSDYIAMCSDGALSDLIQFSLKSSGDGKMWMLSPSPGKNRVAINGQVVVGMAFLAPGMVVELFPEGAENGVARLTVKGEMRIQSTPGSPSDSTE